MELELAVDTLCAGVSAVDVFDVGELVEVAQGQLLRAAFSAQAMRITDGGDGVLRMADSQAAEPTRDRPQRRGTSTSAPSCSDHQLGSVAACRLDGVQRLVELRQR